ncbi:OmpA family protein [Halomonas sp. ISL-60]|uniref:OmpA family protein n=1 Tax=Halomonas sp. ISL-56 TaxID=2819149 RepID=UPI001BE893B3|nr:OmpA family protein [Halomonas sp. ISL-56]MBT2773746.1 OmpA family protein [Halomonas sp. ISL-60]MBT2801783.1 OmpA family protein [Halomonas sp. ISL-56]
MKKIVVLLLLLALPYLSSANEDVEGSGDHPLIERVAGSYIGWFSRSDFEQVTVPTGPFVYRQGYDSTETLEGEHLRIVYFFDESTTSTLRIMRSYQQSLERAGFEVLFSGRSADNALDNRRGTRFMGRYSAVERMGFKPQMRLPMSHASDVAYLAVRSADRNVLAAVVIFMPARSDTPVVLLDVVTTTEMDSEMAHEPLKADRLATELDSQGRVALQQIHFAFDSAEILPESSEALAEVARLLQAETGLRLLVVGHTDSDGSFEYNLRLSADRAQAVNAYLERQHDIQADRLRASGAGMMAPLASNHSEEGRSLNRRVELVELPN